MSRQPKTYISLFRNLLINIASFFPHLLRNSTFNSMFFKKVATKNIISLHHSICGNYVTKQETFTKNYIKDCIVSVVNYFILVTNSTKTENVMNIPGKNLSKLRKKIIFFAYQNIKNKFYKSL